MGKREINILDIIFWLAMLVLIIYIILKLFGIINTPEWVNLLPIISLAFAIGAFYQRMNESLNKVVKRTDYLKKSIEQVSKELNENQLNVNKRLFTIEKQEEKFNKLLTIKTK